MGDRDVERSVPLDRFVETLRRLADALESNESFRIQVANRRFVVPGGAELVIEHEVDGANEELAFELQWESQPGETHGRGSAD